MAPRGAIANISFTLDSGSEDEVARDELNAFPTPDSNTENKAPARKTRGKAAQKTNIAPTTKPPAKGRPATRRASGGNILGARKQNAAVTKKTSAKGGRKALAERNNANGSDTEEVDEFDGEEEANAPVEEIKTAKRGRPAKVKKAREDEIVEALAPSKKTRKTANKELAAKKEPKTKAIAKARATKPASLPKSEAEAFTIQETQPEPEQDAMDVEESIEVDELPESMPPPLSRPSARRTQQQSRTVRQTSNGPRRAGSVSDSERDPMLRRKVGDLTKRLEAMTIKYETLKDVALSSKESNFDQLKRRTEQTIKDQDAVIRSLKQQLAHEQLHNSEIASLKKENAQLKKDSVDLRSEKKSLSDSLATALNENKTLSTKLAAARSSAPPENKNVPGSAVKARPTGVILPGTVEAAKEAQLQKQKIDLYSDLTNLVVLGSKRNEEDEDVYDCLQTGRNGTLHFHLTVAGGSETYEETEFMYNPLLNEQRDKELLDLLPDYLTEEICFPRAQAPKFYMKLVDSMSKKIILEDE